VTASDRGPVAPGHEFRRHWPHLTDLVWLNTPSIAPAADAVAAALWRAIDRWQRGEQVIDDWEDDVEACRTLIARLLGRPRETVALVGSLAEAASLVASSLPPGQVVVAAEEFRSNLFPWLALGERGREVVVVPPRGGLVADADLIAAITPQTRLVTVSEVTSWDGHRRDLGAIVEAARANGARVFANLTQTAGVLRHDFAADRPDYLSGHCYKWLLAPRGTGFLSAPPELLDELRPLTPSWRTPAEPYARFFGEPYEAAPDASKLDAPPAWLSWTGARAGLELIAGLDAHAVEAHCLALAAAYAAELPRLGLRPIASRPSQIVVARTARAAELVVQLGRRGIVAGANGDRLRVGLHAFNTEEDVGAVLAALRQGSKPQQPDKRQERLSSAKRGDHRLADP
jgi:selenocysteine lyase/cysteine desulfurase